ncbi:MAG: TIR domain-containing protein [Bacteroidales bacterium]|nr:TIR domain-containing protein [Bacteroidales bacterium]
MALFKCKMCGGSLEITSGATVIECEYCGTKQTLPKLDDDKRANMYDRANHFRRNNEFDKAMGIYEQILNEDNTDAEAYWSIVLCRYGIEYVEDPASHKRIPTVNRAQFTSILADEDYKSALANADTYQRNIYELEAKAIDAIQRGILAISQKEEPFDVFICYKETDNNGRRTLDSVLAQELYFGLKNEGFKVFFSRITLEDKLGSAYEPYIFAALNSAKVMVVLGTKPEHFDAVWVKNEWSRYLALIQQGQKKMLIPAYKDMNPYDLPEEFSHLQAQDMSKLGFMQDLIRGIKKIIKATEPKPAIVKETIVASPVNVGVAPLLKRIFIFIEDEDWEKADEYCEKVLDIDPENAQAYICKLMVEFEEQRKEDLWKQGEELFDSPNYEKAVKYAKASDPATYAFITELVTTIGVQDFDKKYVSLAVQFKRAESEEEFLSLSNKFNELCSDEWAQKSENYSEALRLIEVCKEKAIIAKQEWVESTYSQAISLVNSECTEYAYREAARLLGLVSGYKDSDELAAKYLENAEVASKDTILSVAKAKMRNDVVYSCEDAIRLFSSIPGWRDADEQKQICIEKMANLIERDNAKRERQAEMARVAEKKAKRLNGIIILGVLAVIAFITIWCCVIIPKIEKSSNYNKAMALMEAGLLKDAYEKFIALGDYKDSAEQAESIRNTIIESCKVGSYITLGKYEQDNNLSNGAEPIEWLVLEIKNGKALVVSKYALEQRTYNTTKEHVNWSTCSLRQWLNNDFLNTAFSDKEKALLSTTTVTADRNPSYNTSPGSSTQDKVFLLSITEANKYFTSNTARIGYATPYATKTDLTYRTCAWWLRTPGSQQHYAAYVNVSGAIQNGGYAVISPVTCVRPAMWIDLSKVQ